MGALSFLTPWFLVGALAVAVPVLLHLLRREQTPALAFSAVRFLRQAPREQARRRQLRDIWLLLLRMLALVVLALAFARPYLRSGEAAATGLTVVALDTSFSMGARPVEGDQVTRFERARRAALSLVSSAPAGDRVAAMAFDDRAALVSPPSVERGSARAAFNSLAPGVGATNYGALFASAARIFGQAGGKLVVVTDLQRSGWTTEGALPANVAVEVVDVAGPVDNVAIVALRRDGDTAVVTIGNTGSRARTLQASLAIDGRAVAQKPVTLEPGQTELVRFDASLPDAGVARVTIDDKTGLAPDNERVMVLDPPRPPSVLILSQREDGEDAFYLREAIQAIDGPRGFTIDLVKASDRNSLEPERLKAHPIVWLMGTRGLDRRVRDHIAAYARDGGALLVTAGPQLDPSTFASLFEQAGRLRVESAQGAGFPTTLAPVETRHPIFAAFGTFASNLGEASFGQGLRIVAPAESRLIARFTNGLPALVEQPVGTGRILFFASDVSGEWNDFPRQPTFVPFVNETLRYLANQRDEPRELAVGNVPAGVPAKPGVARIGTPVRTVAVNVDARESRPDRMTEGEFTQMVKRTQAEGRSGETLAREQEAGQRWWRYGLLLLLAVMVGEGLVARRPGRGGAPTGSTGVESGPAAFPAR